MGLNAIKTLKKSVGYITQPQSCQTCIHATSQRIVIINNTPRLQRPFCKKNEFLVTMNSTCDLWKSEHQPSTVKREALEIGALVA